jgi:hypothetical protein
MTGAGMAAADRFGEAARSLLLFADDPAEVWGRDDADDPGVGPAQIGAAYLRCPSSKAPDGCQPHATRPTQRQEVHPWQAKPSSV